MDQLEIGGIYILVFVAGLVEFIKSVAKLTESAAQLVTVCVGVACVGLAHAINGGLIPDPAVVYVELVFVAVAGALAILGFYQLAANAGRSFANRVGASMAQPNKHRFE